MRLRIKITCVFIIFALLTSCVTATENKDLPTKKEITDFIAGIPVSDNYIITVFNTVIDKQPTWNCDIWEDKNGNQLVSLYYVDPGSAKGYGSMYFNEFGKEISTRGLEIVSEPVNHYVGKANSEENPPVTTPVDTPADSTEEQSPDEEAQPVKEEVQSVGDERLAEYEEQLAEYEERLNEYEEDQLVKYEDQPVNNYPPSVEDESKSVDEMAQTVKDTAQVVENVTQTVENVATRVEEEETKKDNGIHEIFVTVVGGVIVLIIERYLKQRNR